MTIHLDHGVFAEDAAALHALVPTMPAKHIAVFIYALTGGGAQRRTVTLANAFAECGHDVDLVVVHAAGVIHHELAPRVRLVDLGDGYGRLHVAAARRGAPRGLQTALAVPALARYLRRRRPDVLLSAASHVNLVAVAAARLSRTPIPLVLRTSNHPSGNLAHHPPAQRLVRAWLKWLARRFYPRADAIVAVSRGVARELGRLTGLPPERITVIDNPVLTARLRRRMAEPLEHPWLAAGSPPVILAAGRFGLQKDFPTLLEAFRRIAPDCDARLVILGEGSGRQALAARATALGLGDRVLMPGYVDNPLAWMCRARLFVLSSLWEGLPGVLVEALACGLPVVSTACPSGPAEILEDGAHGTLVPVGDAEAMGRAILATLAARPEPERLRARAEHFALAPAIKAYLDVLEGVIRRRAPERLAWSPPWPLTVRLSWTSPEGLARALGRVCLGPGDLFRAWPGNADHRQRMARMIEQFALDPDRAATRHWQELVAADARCAGCLHTARCTAWLARPGPVAEAAGFCPNAGLFATIAGETLALAS